MKWGVNILKHLHFGNSLLLFLKNKNNSNSHSNTRILIRTMKTVNEATEFSAILVVKRLHDGIGIVKFICVLLSQLVGSY